MFPDKGLVQRFSPIIVMLFLFVSCPGCASITIRDTVLDVDGIVADSLQKTERSAFVLGAAITAALVVGAIAGWIASRWYRHRMNSAARTLDELSEQLTIRKMMAAINESGSSHSTRSKEEQDQSIQEQLVLARVPTQESGNGVNEEKALEASRHESS